MHFRIIVALAFTLSVVSCSNKESQNAAAPDTSESKSTQNDLPALIGEKADGTTIDFKEISGETVIVLFQTDCDHCQREATEIKNHLGEFKNYSLYFVTSGPWTEIDQFAKTYGPYNEPRVSFVSASVQSILANFGSVPTPSVYVFGPNGKQKTKFNGETDIMKIIGSL